MRLLVFPGQGSQKKGMGEDLFSEFADLTAKADEILGYSIGVLCLEDPNRELNQTRFTQPALYVVNALSYLRHRKTTPASADFLAGHSLGEYNALFAGGAFDFETGLRLVQKRGELMSQASGGTMAAVLGLERDEVSRILEKSNLVSLDIANYNSSTQLVLAGPREDVENAKEFFEEAGGRYVFLNVSAPFHSRYMQNAREKFEKFLEGFELNDPAISVISNVTARPYVPGSVKRNLVEQITGAVQWTDSIRFLMGRGITDFLELGPGQVLGKLITKIQSESKPLTTPAPAEPETRVKDVKSFTINAGGLGSPEFKRTYNLRHAYLAGAMYKGIASKELVVAMGRAGYMGFFGAGGVRLPEIEETIRYIQTHLKEGESYGMNLICNLVRPEAEMEAVRLYLRYGIRVVEAAAYMQITPALALYRLQGLEYDEAGRVLTRNKVIAKVSRPEVAEMFLSRVPERVLQKLLEQGLITERIAEMARRVPMADDICVEADSGGHTDRGVITTLLPVILRLRDELCVAYKGFRKVCVGASGGIGTPEAAASAFMLGADFILTGSINQCTVEAGTSDEVKNMLQDINVQDTDYAPAGDMFELGAKVQVVRKGVFFPVRANKLYELWKNHNSLEEIDGKSRAKIEEKYFKRSFEEVYEETRAYYLKTAPHEIEKARVNPKHKMALIFRWYFIYTMRLALKGQKEERVDFQIHSGPALGAFNQWVKGSDLESWRNRHVDEIGEKLMEATAELLTERMRAFVGV